MITIKKTGNAKVDKKLELIAKSIEKMETKANEAESTGQAGYGGNWVDTSLSKNILDKVRESAVILNQFSQVDMPTSTFKIPAVTSDATFYYTDEEADVPGTAVTSSKVGTDYITLTAKKLSASVYLTGELEEDAIVSMRTYIENNLSKAYQETIDKLILNGDTDSTGSNINYKHSTATPPAGSYYLALDGLRDYMLGSSDRYVDAGTLDSTDLRDARKILGVKGLNPNDLVWIVEANTYYKLLNLSQVETVEKFGVNATIKNGTLQAIDGIKVIPTGYISLTGSDGKYDAETTSNNTKGTMILVYKPAIITGFKRKLKMFVDYLPEYDQYRIVAHTRFALAINDKDGVAPVVGCINITV